MATKRGETSKKRKAAVKRGAGNKTKRQRAKKQSSGISKKTLLLWGVRLFMGALTVMFLFVLFVYLGLFGSLPTYSELSKIKQNTASEVYSSDGKLMGRYYIQNRITIDNKDISKYVKEALIATEDSRFFEHKGIDFVSLGRVIVKSILLGDRSQGGGSTISQQLAKNLYPRKNLGFLTLPAGKIKEIFTAGRLEKIYTKEEILTLYLNTVPFGENIYGIETASERFFSKSSKYLDPAESATLIGMLAANTRYNPHRNPELSLKRRNVVLDRMVEHGYLTSGQAGKYKVSPIKLHYRKIDRNTGIAPYFREKIRKEIEKILKDKFDNEYDLLTDGLKITTTIDSRLQGYAASAVHRRMKRLQQEFNRHWKGREPWRDHPDIYIDALKRSERYKNVKKQGKSEEETLKVMNTKVSMKIFSYDGEKEVMMSPADSVKYYLKLLNAGFIAINPSNGHILAWVGGIDHKTFQYDHVTARRQVGSTFKPIVYTAAMIEGMEPDTYISNERHVYEQYDDWSPANHDGNYEGYYSLKGGLVNSVNTISAEVIVRTGIDEVIALAGEMGITSPIPEVPSIALGTAEISLLEMVRAYATFPNYGRPVKSVDLLKIEDRDGNVLWEQEPNRPEEQIYDEQVAFSIVDMLRGVVERGTARGLRSTYGLKSTMGGKTGTTQNNSDGWFIGFTPGLVAGAWVGNDNPSIHFRTTALGQGAHTALPIFARFMQQTERDASFNKFTRRSFYALPYGLAMKLSVPDYTLEDPDQSIFDRVFDAFSKPDSIKLKKRQERRERKTVKKKRDQKSILERMKSLFRRR